MTSPSLRSVRTIRDGDLTPVRIEAEVAYGDAPTGTGLTVTYTIHGTTAVLDDVRLDGRRFNPRDDGAAVQTADAAIWNLPSVNVVEGVRAQLTLDGDAQGDADESSASEEDTEQASAEVSN